MIQQNLKLDKDYILLEGARAVREKFLYDELPLDQKTLLTNTFRLNGVPDIVDEISNAISRKHYEERDSFI